MSFLWLAVIAAFLVLFAFLWVIHVSGAAHRRKVGDLKRQLHGLAEPMFNKQRLSSIRVPCATTLEFMIRPEDALTEKMRQYRELSELQTGDLAFDRSMYIESEDSRVGAWLRRDPEARSLVAALVGSKRGVILATGWLALGAVDLLEVGGDLPGQATRLQRLAALVPRITGPDPVSAPHRSRLRVVRRLSYLVVTSSVLTCSVAYADWILNPFPQHVAPGSLLLGAALVGAALATPAYLSVLRAARETSQAPRLRSELFVNIWISVVAITVLAAHQYNLRTIVGEEHAEETTIAGLHSKRQYRSTSYSLMLPALDAGRIPAAHYRSSYTINQGLRDGQPVRVYWREGTLSGFIITRPPEPLPDAH